MQNKTWDFLEKEEFLKRKLLSDYIYLIIFILVTYSCFFFWIKSTFAYYSLGCAAILLYSWLIMRKNYPINGMVHLYLITFPIFITFILLNLWKYSIAGCIWFFPVPFGAYIFLKRKYVYIYSAYVIFFIILCHFLSSIISFDYLRFETREQMMISDSITFVSNTLIILLFLYYLDKINKEKYAVGNNKGVTSAEISQDVVFQERKIDQELQNQESHNDEKYLLIFNKAVEAMNNSEHFRNPEFTISNLSAILKINNLYLSKAIKSGGYDNFNHFINTYKIKYVKKLIDENNLEKVTLMYIYTASGFANQSTFNRAFKQIEGVTPSEYVQTLNKNNLYS